jgi:hypothetical protein
LVVGLVEVARALLFEEGLADLFDLAIVDLRVLVEGDLQQLSPINPTPWIDLQHGPKQILAFLRDLHR